MDKKIKVLLITPSLQCGGAERFVTLLCDYIDTNRIELILVVLDNADPFFKIDNPEIRIIDLKTSRVSLSFFKMKKIIKEEDPDVVFTTANHLNLLIAMGKFLLPGRIMFIARETSVVSMNARFARFPGLYRFLLKRFYRNLDHIICQSSFMQNDLVQHFGLNISKTSIVYNAADPSLVYYDGPVAENSLITVARLTPEKGIDTILRSISALDIPFHYHIVGDGPERRNLEALSVKLGMKSKVSFYGQQSAPFEEKESSQLYLMASLYEGYPNAVIEANVLGIPVVAKNVPGGIADIIHDGKNGFLAENDEDFRKKIKQALSFPFNRQSISEDARKRFSIAQMINQVELLLYRLCNINKN